MDKRPLADTSNWQGPPQRPRLDHYYSSDDDDDDGADYAPLAWTTSISPYSNDESDDGARPRSSEAARAREMGVDLWLAQYARAHLTGFKCPLRHSEGERARTRPRALRVF